MSVVARREGFSGIPRSEDSATGALSFERTDAERVVVDRINDVFIGDMIGKIIGMNQSLPTAGNGFIYYESGVADEGYRMPHSVLAVMRFDV